ncbi:MAG: GNAT family N-acetyltransferase [Rhizobiales bacterium]|nr:GNAT family N-acetyltransferase [Hyphomicrobiales bacterium]
MAAAQTSDSEKQAQADPHAWECRDVLRGGERIFMRPLRPADAALYPEFLAAVSNADMRLRFFAPVKELSSATIAQLTNLDYAKAMAFIALDERSGAMLGVVRLHHDPDCPEGEFAVLVRSALKGHGLGWLLMRHMVAYAMASGYKRIHGEVLAENTTMLDICAHLGFHVTDKPGERGVKRVTLDLTRGKSDGNRRTPSRV